VKAENVEHLTLGLREMLEIAYVEWIILGLKVMKAVRVECMTLGLRSKMLWMILGLRSKMLWMTLGPRSKML
jgi:hypothetical protein